MRRVAYLLVASALLWSGCLLETDDDDHTDSAAITECHVKCDDHRTTCAAGCNGNTCSVDCDKDRDTCYTDCK